MVQKILEKATSPIGHTGGIDKEGKVGIIVQNPKQQGNKTADTDALDSLPRPTSSQTE